MHENRGGVPPPEWCTGCARAPGAKRANEPAAERPHAAAPAGEGPDAVRVGEPPPCPATPAARAEYLHLQRLEEHWEAELAGAHTSEEAAR